MSEIIPEPKRVVYEHDKCLKREHVKYQILSLNLPKHDFTLFKVVYHGILGTLVEKCGLRDRLERSVKSVVLKLETTLTDQI